MIERFPDEFARWRAGDPDPGAGIETLDDLGKRVGAAFQEAADLVPGGTVVVTTHGGGARQGVGHLLGWDHLVLRTIGSLSNCHWTELRYDDGVRRRTVAGWHLRAHNVGVIAASAAPVPAAASASARSDAV